jgi:hypothetical protein
MNPDAVVVRSQALMEAEVDGELVGLHVAKGVCYGFNKTATRLWLLIEQPRVLSELIDQLMREFHGERAVCEREVVELLEDLRSDGLVRIEE